jgi:UDP-N-acetylglucosamine 4-epimerase
MIRNESVFVNGNGETARDFCYVGNVVQANLLAAMSEDSATVNQVYNIAVGDKTTLNQLFELIRALLEPNYPHVRHLRPTYRAFRPGDVRLSQADIGKAQRLLGYEPRWRVRDGLASAIGWYAAALSPRQETTATLADQAAIS